MRTRIYKPRDEYLLDKLEYHIRKIEWEIEELAKIGIVVEWKKPEIKTIGFDQNWKNLQNFIDKILSLGSGK